MNGVSQNSFGQSQSQPHDPMSFRKAVASNNKESIEKQLSNTKSISEV